MPNVERKFLVGRIDDTIVVLRTSTSGGHLSICADLYDSEAFTAEQGEERAREYLMEGDLWRDNVADHATDMGLEEWVEEVLSVDGWEFVVGEVVAVNIDGFDRYMLCSGGGQAQDTLKRIIRSGSHFASKQQLLMLYGIWEVYHLVDVSEIPTHVLLTLEDLVKAHSPFQDDHLAHYADRCD